MLIKNMFNCKKKKLLLQMGAKLFKLL